MNLLIGNGSIRVKGSATQHALITASHIGFWNPGARGFICPATPLVVEKLNAIACGNLLIEGDNAQHTWAAMLRFAENMGKPARVRNPLSGGGLRVNGVKTPLWAHQAQAFWLADSLRSTMLSMCVGAGKSLTAIAMMTAWNFRRVLIVAPPHILKDEGTWPAQFDRHLDKEVVILQLIKGTTRDKLEDLIEADKHMGNSKVPLVAMTNYETIWREPLADYLLECPTWRGLAVLDEIHRIKSPTGIASRFMAKLCARQQRVLGLTGTVMPHSPMDVFAQYRSLDPGLFGLAFGAFRDKFAVVRPMGDIPIIVGYKNQQELAALMDTMTYHCDASVIDLPKPVDVARRFDLSGRERKAYDDLEEDCLTVFKKGEVTIENVLVRTLRLAQVTSGFVKDDDGVIHNLGQSKRDLLKEELYDLPENEPIVVYCRFRKDLTAVHKTAKELKRASGEVSGRADDLKQWKRGEFPILAVQMQSAEGIDLTRSHYGIFYSIDYSGGRMLQARGRMQRPGQTSLVRFSHLIARHTVNEAVYAAIEKNQSVAKAIISYFKNKA